MFRSHTPNFFIYEPPGSSWQVHVEQPLQQEWMHTTPNWTSRRHPVRPTYRAAQQTYTVPLQRPPSDHPRPSATRYNTRGRESKRRRAENRHKVSSREYQDELEPDSESSTSSSSESEPSTSFSFESEGITSSSSEDDRHSREYTENIPRRSKRTTSRRENDNRRSDEPSDYLPRRPKRSKPPRDRSDHSTSPTDSRRTRNDRGHHPRRSTRGTNRQARSNRHKPQAKSGSQQYNAKSQSSSGESAEQSCNSSYRSRGNSDQASDFRSSLSPEPSVNYYEILGLEIGASHEKISQASKVMRIRFHPDKLIKPGMSEDEKTEINERAKWIGQAAEILMDPVQREEHDKELQRYYNL